MPAGGPVNGRASTPILMSSMVHDLRSSRHGWLRTIAPLSPTGHEVEIRVRKENAAACHMPLSGR